MDPHESVLGVIPTAWHICTRRMVEISIAMVLRGFYLARSLPATCQTRINVPFVTDGDYRAAI
jgi:hypothetical protein